MTQSPEGRIQNSPGIYPWEDGPQREFALKGRPNRVSESNVETVTAYISDQAEHHRRFSYDEEIRELLKRHRVAFDERYLWD